MNSSLALDAPYYSRIPHAQCLSPRWEMERRRILFVDDDLSVREYLTALLGGEGFVVDAVPNGLTGLLNLIRTPYDFLILDLLLPDMDGLSLYRLVRNINKKLADRTIILTGLEENHPLLQQARKTTLPILPKPIPNLRLFAILDNYCLEETL